MKKMIKRKNAVNVNTFFFNLNSKKIKNKKNILNKNINLQIIYIPKLLIFV